jgi:hypothetical protein
MIAAAQTHFCCNAVVLSQWVAGQRAFTCPSSSARANCQLFEIMALARIRLFACARAAEKKRSEGWHSVAPVSLRFPVRELAFSDVS